MEIKSLAREEILQKLQDCSRIRLIMRGQPQEKRVGFDGQTGLETGPLGPLTVTWSDPPMVLERESRPQVLLSIDGKKVFGMTKQKLEEMIAGSPNCDFECFSLSPLVQIERVPSLKEALEDRFKRDQVAIHPGYQCAFGRSTVLVQSLHRPFLWHLLQGMCSRSCAPARVHG